MIVTCFPLGRYYCTIPVDTFQVPIDLIWDFPKVFLFLKREWPCTHFDVFARFTFLVFPVFRVFASLKTYLRICDSSGMRRGPFVQCRPFVHSYSS